MHMQLHELLSQVGVAAGQDFKMQMQEHDCSLQIGVAEGQESGLLQIHEHVKSSHFGFAIEQKLCLLH